MPKLKKKPVVTEDSLDGIETQGLKKYFPVKPPENGVWPEVTDAELVRLKAHPSWVWAGMYDTVMRLIARIEAQDKRLASRPKIVSPLDSVA
jgi:hypothetical protein